MVIDHVVNATVVLSHHGNALYFFMVTGHHVVHTTTVPLYSASTVW